MSQQNPVKWHFFMFAPGDPDCQGRDEVLTHKGVSRNTIQFDSPGVYEADVDVSAMGTYSRDGTTPLPWDWTNAVSRAGRNFANTEETAANTFPIRVEIKVWLVAAGGTFVPE